MKKKLLLLFGAMVIVVLMDTALISVINRKAVKENSRNNVIHVVTSFYPNYIIGLNLADQIPEIQVDCLTNNTTGCLHDYQLTTDDLKTLSSADIFLMNGGGMESFISDVVKNYPDLKIINISEGIPMLKSEVEGDYNAHVWLDPKRYTSQIENARDGLTELINGLTEMSKRKRDEIIQKLNSNSDAYIKKVNKLEDELEKLLKDDNKNASYSFDRSVVIFHEAFAYLADRIGLKVAAVVEIENESGLDAEKIAGVIHTVKENNIRYLFTEKQYSASIADRIMDETGAKVYIIDSAVTGDGTKDSYLNSMENNIQTLKKAFQ